MSEMSSHFCDELAELFPPAEELLIAFEKHGDEAAADRWLSSNDIDSTKLKAAGITCRMVSVMGSHDFDVLRGQARGEIFYEIVDDYEHRNVLAIPIMSEGEFLDLLLADPNDPSIWRVMYGRADWLGYDAIGYPEVRLHYSPFAWLEAGGVGVCNVHPHYRGHFKDLDVSERIVCDDIDTAMEAWEWAFGGSDDKLDRIVCDDDPENIKAYFERQAFWEASSKVRRERCKA